MGYLQDTEYHIVRFEAVLDAGRKHEIDFALTCLNDEYGYATKFGLGIDG